MSKEYSSYRYVGQKWAAEIPEHWDAKRLKVIFSIEDRTKQSGHYRQYSFTDCETTTR